MVGYACKTICHHRKKCMDCVCSCRGVVMVVKGLWRSPAQPFAQTRSDQISLLWALHSGLLNIAKIQMLQILYSSVRPLPFSFHPVRIAHVPVYPSYVSSYHWVRLWLLHTPPVGSNDKNPVYGPCASKAPLNMEVL